MPRTGRGGSRQGTPGQTYANRTDLNQPKLPVTTVPGQAYGVAGAQAAAQEAVPLPNNTAPPPAAPPPRAVGPLPGELGGLDRETDRPAEPLMHGSPMGAGAGPEVLTTTTDDNVGMALRAMYQQFPNQDMADLIQQFDAGRQ